MQCCLMTIKENYVAWRLEHQLHFNRKIRESVLPYFMSDPQALHVTRNVIPGKLGVDLHLHRVHIPLVVFCVVLASRRLF